ncbi:MgtC/SapB family protein [Microvirga lotononidis]|uniref:Protein MgtC n=1 Tax=Microvirga lotononidis TaxID=864069 RepID=I4Z002_9HYPH|nr:MgtC/SapB family protein [Microvirga lotononidis]EIM29544.1 putative membrane protein [Microvirga lotononidis]WQO27146.1 MgtC/SapB family protein [Microvirga lotononidis]
MSEWLSSLSTDYANQIEMSLRLCAATIAGMAIGINRDIHDKPIGMRTLGLVSLGSAIVILAGSVYEGTHFGQDAVSRVIQGIMTGLGFLGAGAVLRAPDKMEVHGLTTAATVWIAAGLGVAAGLGAWFVTIAGTVVTLLVLTLGKSLEDMLTRLFSSGDKPGGE